MFFLKKLICNSHKYPLPVDILDYCYEKTSKVTVIMETLIDTYAYEIKIYALEAYLNADDNDMDSKKNWVLVAFTLMNIIGGINGLSCTISNELNLNKYSNKCNFPNDSLKAINVYLLHPMPPTDANDNRFVALVALVAPCLLK